MWSTRTLRWVTWAVCLVTTSLAWAGVVLAMVEPERTGLAVGAGGVGLAAFEAIVYTALGVLGSSVTSRQPRNPVGWLLQLTPLAMAITTVSNRLYFHALLSTGKVEGTASYAAWLASWMWIFAIVPAFTIFPLLFPTGRPLSRRWRALVWIAVLAGAVTWFGTAFLPGPIPYLAAAVNPFGIDSPVVKIVGSVGFGVLVPTAFASIASVVVRYRRSTGIERQQLKWVAAAAALLPVATAGGGVGDDDSEVGFVFLLSGLLIVGLAVAVAMLRYRLYDIDAVINRTLVYGALTATLAAAYLGSVLLLQFVLSPLTQDSELAVAGSTLGVAALFRPARARIQGWVDRRFYRSRYDAAQTLAAFSGRLREQLDLEALSADLRGVVQDAVRPAHVSVWLREG